ncbi:MAG: dihydrofolate reductase family protein [Pseudomonadota bacterium]
MTSGHVFIATSLDGFIARKDGSLDWLMKQSVGGENHGYDAFIESVDGLVMGRGTFEQVLSFGDWPYPKPVIVLSSTLSNSDLRPDLVGKVTIRDEVPEAVMADLERQGWRRAYIDGGQVIQSFLRKGLIEDLLLTRVPILLGEGLPLFGLLDRDIDMQHMGTNSFPSGLVTSRYKILPAPG